MSSNMMQSARPSADYANEQEIEQPAQFNNEDDSFDIQIKNDLAAGRLDTAIAQALEDERNGRIRPL